MSKKAGVVLTIFGAVLIFSALLLWAFSRYQTEEAGRQSESLMAQLESWMQQMPTATENSENSGVLFTGDAAEPTAPEETEPETHTLPPDMPTVVINGYEYVGYLEFPTLKLKLPVLSQWDENLLKIAPCRHQGSTAADNLVIAAHNYTVHFGKLSLLSPGATVKFTDMDGVVHTYAVAKIATLDPREVNAVLNSEFDLVLYTCTLSGKSRITVFCNRIDDAN